ncbi:MAG: restriction endonuclease subunit S [Accumulibacter sp.]|uniref:restriction endonuclease subunit S n=1 Tax=Accumulibacter sp. TaxID=2053492 RepID=UPI002FC33790
MTGVELVPLGEVVTPTRPRVKPSDYPDLPFIGMEHVEAHSMKLLGTVPSATMKSSAVHFKPGDVLYGRLRPYLNKVCRPTFEGLCSAEFIVLPENGRVDSGYLQHFLNSSAFVRYASHLNTGDRPRVDFDQLAPFEIPLPDPNEQRRIVAEIEKQFSRVDEAVANLKRVKANAARLVGSVLIDATAGRLVQRSTAAWRTVQVCEAGEVLLGRQRAPQYLTGRWLRKYLRVANIKDDAISFSDVETMDFDEAHFAKYRLAPGDILVSEGQSSELLGQSAIFRGFDEPLCFQKTLHRFRADPEVTTPEFAQIVFRSHVRSGIFRRLGSITTNIGHLTLEKFKAAPFPLPPLDEQHRIVAEVDRRLSIVREVAAEVDANVKRAEALRQAVLAQAFSVESHPISLDLKECTT